MTPGSRDRRPARYPSCLQSRSGWAEYLELLRTPEPHLHQIEPTNHCPYSCIMCPRPTEMNRSLGFMELDLFRKVIDEVAGYSEPVRSKEIELFHFGESLLHKKLDQMIRYSSERNLRVTLSVNGPQLTPEMAGRVLGARPFRLIVSLDGDDAESYRAIRGKNADFEKALRNIEGLVKVHSDIKSKTRISIRMIRMRRNEGQIEAYRARWKQQNMEVEIRDFFPWGETKMASLGEYEQYPPYMPCPFPWQYVVVQWNGDVVPCCRDYNAVLKIGNVKNSTLKQIWNGREYREFRSQMASVVFRNNPVCKQCLSLYHQSTPI